MHPPLPTYQEKHMNTLEFYQRVLPSKGFYVLAYFAPGVKYPKHIFCDSLTKAAAATKVLNDRGMNTYYAVASYKEDTRRTHNNCDRIRSFFLDIDCGPGKPFPSWKEGLVALGKYLDSTKLPMPMIVRSGNGLHVYWALTEELSRREWLPTANALKQSIPLWYNPHTDREEPIFDPAVPADSSRILRPIGTINPKGGKEVKLLKDAAPVSHDDVRSCVSKQSGATKKLQAAAKDPVSSLASKAIIQSEFPPANSQLVESKCQQVAWAVNNQARVSEPLWYALMGVAAHCEDPEETAKRWSREHPNYSEAETLKKMAQWKVATDGPATCAKFCGERASGCEGCRFLNKIATPVMLGVSYKEVTTPQPTAASATTSANQYVATPLPKPYKRTAQGIVATVDEVDIPVCEFDIYPVSYGKEEGASYEVVRFHWNRRNVGWQELIVRQAHLTPSADKEFGTAVADQGIVFPSKKSTELFKAMLRDYAEELKRLKTISNKYNSMGWKENYKQFVLGDTLYKRDDKGNVTQETLSVPGMKANQMAELYSTKGSHDTWKNTVYQIDKAGITEAIFCLGVSFSAPLYELYGLKGIAVNLVGPTGAGKTLIQHLVQSVWGEPSGLQLSASTTYNYMFSRIALYNNLPTTIDEVTIFNPKDIGDLLYKFTQGREKARLTRTATEMETRTWAAPQIMSANRSLMNTLMTGTMESDAQAARLLEIHMIAKPIFANDSRAGSMLYKLIQANYGHAGREFLEYIMKLGADELQRMMEEHRQSFYSKYDIQFAGHERFWEQLIVAADFALSLLHEAGMLRVDYQRAVRRIVSNLHYARKSIADNRLDSFDLITEYINEFSGAALTVIHTGTNKPIPDQSRIPRQELRIRFDLYRKSTVDDFDRGIVLIDRLHFRNWLNVRGGDIRQVMDDVKAEQADATPKIKKAYLGKDSPIRTGQQYVVGISLQHDRLAGILSDAQEAVETSMADKIGLRVV